MVPLGEAWVPKDMLTRVVPLSEENRKRVEAWWDTADLVDAWGREWVRSIEAIQGNAYLLVVYLQPADNSVA